MRLDFSQLTQNSKKIGGTGGTGGTSPVYAASSGPILKKAGGTRWDKIAKDHDFVPPVPNAEKNVGQRKPASILDVPPVPPVPPQEQTQSLRQFSDPPLSENGDLIRDFMEVDGMTLEQAQVMAAISIKPRPTADWLADIKELDQLIGVYCDVARLGPESVARISLASSRQSLASIPDCLVWFRQQCRRLTHLESSEDDNQNQQAS